jgi:hypothetical protein
VIQGENFRGIEKKYKLSPMGEISRLDPTDRRSTPAGEVYDTPQLYDVLILRLWMAKGINPL